MERVMKWNRRGYGALTAVTAGALALSLGACDQIQSLWKTESERSTNAAATTGTVAQQAPVPVEAKIEMAKSDPSQRAVVTPKIDEDATLAARVTSALGADPALRLLAIDAKSSGGVVTLYGTADTRAHRERVERVTSSVPGVKSVRNELVVVAGS